MERPAKRTKLLSDGASEQSEGEADGGATNGFTINEEYAKRFEHNKKREEMHRLEEKYKKPSRSSNGMKAGAMDGDEEEDSEEEDSEDDEAEDDQGELATRDLDDEISATLQAIRSKDPRVYDKSVTFYKELDTDEPHGDVQVEKEAKPVFLHDYHRQNLLAGYTGEDQDEVEPIPQTYNEEQEALRRNLVSSMHAQTNSHGIKDEAESDEDELLQKRAIVHPEPQQLSTDNVHPSRSRRITDEDVTAADDDPETYLSNFMAARAWVPSEKAQWKPLESDDSDEEKRAEEFEDAFNMRFEDPNTANEKLQSFARSVGKYSVRRDEKGGRKRARDREQEAKEAAKRERDEERARLRKLKIEEAEEKVKRIKVAAGLRGQEIDVNEWRDIIDGDFDDDMWEKEMERRFGEDYYAQADEDEVSEGDAANSKTKRKVKKPKWEDDIDINDLVPDFEENDDEPKFTLSADDEADGRVPLQDGDEDVDVEPKKAKSKKERQKAKEEAKRTARRERRQIEELVDSSLPLSHPTLTPSNPNTPVVGFRYRETSPISFGLSAKDILYADDSQLNQYAGLKKMAAFREDEKKRRDRKRYSKKGRLREWRKETFGDANGVRDRMEKTTRDPDVPTQDQDAKVGGEGDSNVVDGEKKRKRKKRRKAKAGVEVVN